MAWTSPRLWVAGETVTAAIMNTHIRDQLTYLKAGVAASTVVTASSASTSATTELVLATAPAVTTDGTTLVDVSFCWYNITLTVATDIFIVRLYDGPTAGSGTLVASWLVPPQANTGGGNVRAILTPSAAAHTYTARLVRSSGTGTASMFASSAAPASISVAQIN